MKKNKRRKKRRKEKGNWWGQQKREKNALQKDQGKKAKYALCALRIKGGKGEGGSKTPDGKSMTGPTNQGKRKGKGGGVL